MAEPTPTFAGEVQLRRWSESSTQGVQVTFALAESADLDKFKGLDGKRFMAVLVQIGDDEQPVLPNLTKNQVKTGKPDQNREPLGDLCWRAVNWCREPEFQEWVASRLQCHADTVGEVQARDYIMFKCGIESRKELDTNKDAASKFHAMIRGPYQKHLIARGIVR